MLRRDYDGVLTLDVLGDVVLGVARAMSPSAGDELVERFKPAHQAVRRQLMQAELRNDYKLTARYRSLLRFFDERAALWG